MKGLEQTIQRIALQTPSGNVFKPKRRVCEVLQVIFAAHILNPATPSLLYKGTLLAIDEICRRSNGISKTTVASAIKEAERDGLLIVKRSRPSGKRYLPSTYLAPEILLDIGLGDSPWSGPKIVFQVNYEIAPKLSGGQRSGAGRPKRQQERRFVTSAATKCTTLPQNNQNLDPQELNSKLKYKTPAPPPLVGEKEACAPLSTRRGEVGTESQNQEERNLNIELSEFLDWWAKFEKFAFFDFQSRKKNGERGGLLSSMTRPKGTSQTPAAVQDVSIALKNLWTKLAKRMSLERLSRLEGVVRAAGDEHSTLLVDDLKEKELSRFQEFWPGPMALLETSMGNFQAILVSPYPLASKERKFIQLSITKNFAVDQNAAKNPWQFHRFPGSGNWKTGTFFPTRLVLTRDAVDDAVWTEFVEQALRLSQCVEVKPSKVATLNDHSSRPTVPIENVYYRQTGDPSADAFRFALSAHRKGYSSDAIESQVEAAFNQEGKHQANSWARDTSEAARRTAAGSYTTGAMVRART